MPPPCSLNKAQAQSQGFCMKNGACEQVLKDAQQLADNRAILLYRAAARQSGAHRASCGHHAGFHQCYAGVPRRRKPHRCHHRPCHQRFSRWCGWLLGRLWDASSTASWAALPELCRQEVAGWHPQFVLIPRIGNAQRDCLRDRSNECQKWKTNRRGHDRAGRAQVSGLFAHDGGCADPGAQQSQC